MLILAVSILFFGIKVVKQGEGLKDEVLLVDFFQNLDEKIDNYYFLDIGSSGTEEFILPNGVEKVCFINLLNYDQDSNEREKYMKSLREFSNVFIFPNNEFKETRTKIVLNEDNDKKFFVDNNIGDDTNVIDWDGHFCEDVASGRLRINLENKGRFVQMG